jgi:hypothetical protein
VLEIPWGKLFDVSSCSENLQTHIIPPLD